MRGTIVQLTAAFLGSLGFSLLFRLHRRHLLLASIGGMLTWGVYLLLYHMLPGDFLANLTASAFAVTFAEISAHWRKCPATLFLVPAIIPLVPGSSLYYTMNYAVQNDLASARIYGHKTLVAALAIAAGIRFVTVFHELRTSK